MLSIGTGRGAPGGRSALSIAAADIGRFAACASVEILLVLVLLWSTCCSSHRVNQKLLVIACCFALYIVVWLLDHYFSISDAKYSLYFPLESLKACISTLRKIINELLLLLLLLVVPTSTSTYDIIKINVFGAGDTTNQCIFRPLNQMTTTLTHSKFEISRSWATK